MGFRVSGVPGFRPYDQLNPSGDCTSPDVKRLQSLRSLRPYADNLSAFEVGASISQIQETIADLQNYGFG